jgi:hypothetical protein
MCSLAGGLKHKFPVPVCGARHRVKVGLDGRADVELERTFLKLRCVVQACWDMAISDMAISDMAISDMVISRHIIARLGISRPYPIVRI